MVFVELFTKQKLFDLIGRNPKWQEMPVEERVKIVGEGLKRFNEAMKEPYEVGVLWKKLVVLPGVYCPLFADSLLLAKNQGVAKGDYVLDPDCGAGMQSIKAAEDGAFTVVAVAGSEKNFECAKNNFKNLGLGGKIELRQGQMFKGLEKGQKFDVILSNPAFSGTNISAVKELLAGAKQFLEGKGHISMVYSEVGSKNALDRLLEEEGFKAIEVAEKFEYFWYKVLRIERK